MGKNGNVGKRCVENLGQKNIIQGPQKKGGRIAPVAAGVSLIYKGQIGCVRNVESTGTNLKLLSFQ